MSHILLVQRPSRTNLINGRTTATWERTTRYLPATFLAMCRVTAIWTTMVPGMKNRTMARFGIPTLWMLAGLPIVTDIGITSGLGAGRGSATSLGVSHLFTMDVGRISAAIGVGARVPIMRGLYMDRLS